MPDESHQESVSETKKTRFHPRPSMLPFCACLSCQRPRMQPRLLRAVAKEMHAESLHHIPASSTLVSPSHLSQKHCRTSPTRLSSSRRTQTADPHLLPHPRHRQPATGAPNGHLSFRWHHLWCPRLLRPLHQTLCHRHWLQRPALCQRWPSCPPLHHSCWKHQYPCSPRHHFCSARRFVCLPPHAPSPAASVARHADHRQAPSPSPPPCPCPPMTRADVHGHGHCVARPSPATATATSCVSGTACFCAENGYASARIRTAVRVTCPAACRLACRLACCPCDGHVTETGTVTATGVAPGFSAAVATQTAAGRAHCGPVRGAPTFRHLF